MTLSPFWRAMCILVLFILALPNLCLMVGYVVFALDPGDLLLAPFSHYDVSAGNSDGRSFPAAPRKASAPLYLSSHGTHKGEMTWVQMIYSTDAHDDGFVRLEKSDTLAVLQLHGEVGSWVRLSDITFDLHEIAQFQRHIPTSHLYESYIIKMGDWIGDGNMEYLHEDYNYDGITSYCDGFTMYGMANGKPSILLDLSSNSPFTASKQSDGSTAFATKGLIWNRLAYCWRHGKYRRCSVAEDPQRAKLEKFFWADFQASFSSGALIPAIWLFCLFALLMFRTFRINRNSKLISYSLLALQLMLFVLLLVLCWFNYHYFGYVEDAAWRFTMFASSAFAVLILMLIPLIYARISTHRHDSENCTGHCRRDFAY